MGDLLALGRLERMRLRRLLRESGSVLVVAAGLVGAAGGGIASFTVYAAGYLHTMLFGLADDVPLSAAAAINPVQMIAVLGMGGLVIGLLTAFRRKRARNIVDPIEANALHGGRMSASDSAFVAAQSVLSSGFGASLGLEGGFTQAAGAVGSVVGTAMRRRRHDVRMLVAAGAAGAIAGAFGAPTAGAAYGFELILGSYTVANLAPIVVAAVAGAYASEAIFGQGYRIWLGALHFAGGSQFLLLLLLGATCGLLAVQLMRGVTATERLIGAGGIARLYRPVLGGLMLAMLGLVTPHALGSGHGGIALVLTSPWTTAALALVLGTKIVASAVSLGSGFRGGLFSTSLFLGALTGALIASIAVALGVLPADDTALFTLVGMASFAAAVIGTPMTMALLAVEITDSLSVISPVLIGVVVAVLTVRRVFGYSFATWRFHLRGEAILGGEDIGWERDLTARSLMRRDLPTVSADAVLDATRAQYPLGSTKYVAVVDGNGAFLGLLDIAGIHSLSNGNGGLKNYVVHADAIVEARATLDHILPLFEKYETETLVVVDSAQARRVEGLITEAFALRRYRQELERRQREMFG
jgi:CIC family chloride channel protein